MVTKTKIKINDNQELRNKIDELYEKTEQVYLAKWACSMFKRILKKVNIDYTSIDEFVNGYKVNEEWQNGKVRMYDVRQVGFSANRIARDCKDKVKQAAMRAVVQSIGTGHMREHAMVTSDYSIKVINLLFPNDIGKVTKERKWQLLELKQLIN